MKDISRRSFIKWGVAAAAGAVLSHGGFSGVWAQAPVVGSRDVTDRTGSGSRAKVYFSKHIDADHLIRLYDKINDGIYGKTAIKLHTGERHGPNILPRHMVREFQRHVPDSTIVETNTLYVGDRDTTEKHRETLKINGWDFCPVDIMDEDGAVMIPVRGGKHFTEMSVGKHMLNYDSMIVLTHFKGHPRGGFGGSMKNLAIGCADGQIGKRMVHGVGQVLPKTSAQWPGEEPFMENMAESAKATIDFFGKHIVYLNVMRRMSVDCDCTGTAAAEPRIPDIGILASTDLLAVDQASVDLVYAQPEVYRHDLVERMESRKGLHQLQAMRDLKMGNSSYELISID
ncbi:DUF362 domain-containing protein [Megasphaera stantonii]|uniref:DUF362 domain-containing protein n=1 Tax=Megasphaera stantonii TaxID=2144175 RepID=A0A346B0J4_9FIRM|nr:DUF362 domain-containing protein [Megasphaera stantonii]AXL21637.1 DUF362 domain-containing protein [Megasphaera stantonii]